jgi:flavin-dependent dehydrogenase
VLGISAFNFGKKMKNPQTFDIAITGGGLAGLSLAILQAKAGKSVVLFEKNSYPFHRVCGEYVSLESWNFLENLELPLSQMQLPIIKNLQITSPSGTSIEAPLDLGGFGISRYKLDFELAQIAKNLGVKVLETTKVIDIKKTESPYEVITEKEVYHCKMAVGSFGKRSNLDVDWKRPFIEKNRTSLNQYVGVKYHIKTDFHKDKIALHNFSDGYCGISAIEDDLYCLCYMTTKSNLKKSENSIANMEEKILSKNPFLANIFKNCEKLWPQPEVISQISFEKKSQFENEIPLLGDASGMIAPLCGNGMSMAFHGAYLLHNMLESGENIKEEYPKKWKDNFATRLLVGRTVQRLFGNPIMTDLLIKGMKLTPSLLQLIIKNTHGKDILAGNK